ncbi:MAG TPA: N-acetylmuramic acid 6-phosphate etherase [Candidatus Nanopelagicales bacterium]|nr:N-acetylmuramic acid 6-phosphate etherase [Candidatus Nanopelagicales bacterium]
MTDRETERAREEWRGLDLLDVQGQLAAFDAADAEIAPAVAAAGDAIAGVVSDAVAALRAGGRLVYVGAGTAGRIAALDAAEVGPTFGVPSDLVIAVVAGGTAAYADAQEGLEDDEAAGALDVTAVGIRPEDLVVGVTASGSTPYVVAALQRAAQLGARTAVVVSTPASSAEAVVDRTVLVETGPEVVAGSTRLRAGTAQKLVLNRISTLTMVGLGHVYGNLMVGVRPDNTKLRERQRRILQDATGSSREAVDEALVATGRDARAALVLLLTGAPAADAVAAVRAAQGDVRAAVAAVCLPADPS